MMKKLYRSGENKVFAGIFGGLGEYFDVDPVVLRLAWIAITALTGFVLGIAAYIIAIFVVPKKADRQPNKGK
ncbi:MAG: PspC domain-containing protein [Candidatus Pacebacteria bacterium]|nr:PspC domain-containing protein [Candidatus Paceibacterota bacterium]